MVKWFAIWYLGWISKLYGKVAKQMVEEGKGFLFTNVYPFVGELTGNELFTAFLVRKSACILKSDQGPILLVHGTPEGKYQVGDDVIEIDDVVGLFGLWGVWNLVSCFNKFHNKLKGERYILIKQQKLNTEYPIVFNYDDEEKAMYCFSDKKALYFTLAVEWCKKYI